MWKRTELFRAAERGDLQKVERFIGQGVDWENGELAVNHAIKNCHLEIVKALVEKGGVNANSFSILTHTVLKGNLEIIEYLSSKGADFRAGYDCLLIYAAQRGHLAAVRFLVEKGADVGGKAGNEALMSAIFYGRYQVASYLVSKGVNVNAKRGEPLFHSALRENIPMVTLLLRNGADSSVISSESAGRAVDNYFLLTAEPEIIEGIDKTHGSLNLPLMVKKIKGEVVKLEIFLSDIYFRPGGPGFFDAKKRFEKTVALRS